MRASAFACVGSCACQQCVHANARTAGKGGAALLSLRAWRLIASWASSSGCQRRKAPCCRRRQAPCVTAAHPARRSPLAALTVSQSDFFNQLQSNLHLADACASDIQQYDDASVGKLLTAYCKMVGADGCCGVVRRGAAGCGGALCAAGCCAVVLAASGCRGAGRAQAQQRPGAESTVKLALQLPRCAGHNARHDSIHRASRSGRAPIVLVLSITSQHSQLCN